MWQAPLVVQYSTSMGVPTTAEIEEVQITLPPPEASMPGSTALVTRNMLLTLTLISRSQSASLVSRKGPAAMMPAWFISTVIAPKRAWAWLTARCTWSATETSAATNSAWPPAALIRAATASPWLVGKSRITTWAPSAANSSDAASPHPPAPPVISATLPFNRSMGCSSVFVFVASN